MFLGWATLLTPVSPVEPTELLLMFIGFKHQQLDHSLANTLMFGATYCTVVMLSVYICMCTDWCALRWACSSPRAQRMTTSCSAYVASFPPPRSVRCFVAVQFHPRTHKSTVSIPGSFDITLDIIFTNSSLPLIYENFSRRSGVVSWRSVSTILLWWRRHC